MLETRGCRRRKSRCRMTQQQLPYSTIHNTAIHPYIQPYPTSTSTQLLLVRIASGPPDSADSPLEPCANHYQRFAPFPRQLILPRFPSFLLDDVV